jgi:hypothetical protein
MKRSRTAWPQGPGHDPTCVVLRMLGGCKKKEGGKKVGGPLFMLRMAAARYGSEGFFRTGLSGDGGVTSGHVEGQVTADQGSKVSCCLLVLH